MQHEWQQKNQACYVTRQANELINPLFLLRIFQGDIQHLTTVFRTAGEMQDSLTCQTHELASKVLNGRCHQVYTEDLAGLHRACWESTRKCSLHLLGSQRSCQVSTFLKCSIYIPLCSNLMKFSAIEGSFTMTDLGTGLKHFCKGRKNNS